MLILSEEFALENFITPRPEKEEIKIEISENITDYCDGRYPVIYPGENIEIYRGDSRIDSPELITKSTTLTYDLPEDEGKKELNLEVSEDEMEAFIEVDLQPARRYELLIEEERKGILIDAQPTTEKFGEEMRVTEEEIKIKLAEAGIFFGLKKEKIKRIASGDLRGKTTVAEGKYPEEGEPARIEKVFSAASESKEETDESEKVDHYRNIIASILPGEVIAEKVKPAPGKPGRTVRGKKLPAGEGKDIKLTAGKNVTLSADGKEAISLLVGRPELEEKKNEIIVRVLPQYIITGDVDKQEGRVEFDGDLIIEGGVKDFFGARARGEVLIKKNVNNGNIQARQSIYVGGNVVGSEITAGRAEKFNQNKLRAEKLFLRLKGFFESYFESLTSAAEEKKLVNLSLLRQEIMEKKQIRGAIIELSRLFRETASEELSSLPCGEARMNWLEEFIFGTDKFDSDRARNKLREILDELRNCEIRSKSQENGSIILRQTQNSCISAARDIIIMREGSYISRLRADNNIVLKQKNSFFKSGRASAGGWFLSGRAGVPMSQTLIKVGKGAIIKEVSGSVTVRSWADKKTIDDGRKAVHLEVNQDGKLEEKTWQGWVKSVERMLAEEKAVKKWGQL
ncbi:DUF342 domain-containing protein [Halarsenatibacter silvermanii]|uniref:Flagellar Assembly Protein A N-terminal region domain-containing protein n=1 Tax=Halarsenatibacter silvermanii TaxID=321763 RepID=A0A1G9SK26_9FIRM|nr:FapA family protein [Halarsenatibacter silvermanii]SDM35844.1 Protein of unknown function [Halarsenatibacter silvermanii]